MTWYLCCMLENEVLRYVCSTIFIYFIFLSSFIFTTQSVIRFVCIALSAIPFLLVPLFSISIYFVFKSWIAWECKVRFNANETTKKKFFARKMNFNVIKCVNSVSINIKYKSIQFFASVITKGPCFITTTKFTTETESTFFRFCLFFLFFYRKSDFM